MTGTLTGTLNLVRLILRRDRVLLPLWVVFIGALVPVELLSSFRALYPTADGLWQYAEISRGNAAFTALYGKVYGASLGELLAWRSGFVPVMVGLVGLLAVIRHTRTEEEAGRRELLGATVVGRHAGLAAALLTVLAANLVMALLVALVLVGQGLPAAGCIALGLEFAAGGFVFAAVGALAAQVTTGAGTARGGAAVALAAAYVLAVVGDVSGRTWVSWLSPVGWTRQVHPYGVTRWWVFALVAGFTGLLAAGAFALSARRDVGTGLLPSRPGPADAAAGLRTPLALAWRLHRGLLAGWVVGFALLGVVFGAVTRSIGEMLGGNKQLTEVFQRIGGASGLVDAYLAGIVGFLGLVAAGYAIQAALRLRAEEAAGRSEPVLATAVGRLRWAASHLAFALLGPAAALLAAGLATGLVYGVSTGRPGHEVPRLLAAAAVQLPAVWVLAALTVALVGLRPRLAVVSWGALAGCVLVGLVGSAMGASHWLVDASPFTHVPRTPFGPFTATPLVWLVAVALALGTAGLAGLRRRDVPVA